MYHVKPIITSDIKIEYPTSMYKMKPISTDQFTETNNINLNIAGNGLADVSENPSKNPNRDIVQQINNILKVHFQFKLKISILISDSDTGC